MHSQTRIGKPVVNEQGTNRSKNDLMLRLEKCVVAQNVRKFMALLADTCPVAKRAEHLNFGRQLSLAVHSSLIVPLGRMRTKLINEEWPEEERRREVLAWLPWRWRRLDLLPFLFRIREARRPACPWPQALDPIQSGRGY